jgi:hypothetical protein
MASVANINDVLEGHVALEVECVDRLILNAYVPALQVPGQLVRFLCGHLGHPIPSPVMLGRIGDRFRARTRRFVKERQIPVLQLRAPDRSRWDDRKVDHVRPHLERAEREGRFGVVALVVAEEFQRVWSARNRARKPGVASLEFFWERRRVGAYYFYILDAEFGPAFINSNTYHLTPEGIRVAVFYTKLHSRLLEPLLDADKPPARIDIRRALKTLENAVNDYVHDAQLAPTT